MPSRTLRLATVGGVDVRVAPSWLLLAVVIVVGYQRSFAAPGRSTAIAVAMAAAVALLFSASVLLHEVAHALEARHRDVEVGGITLFLLGGATALRDPDRTAADEFAIAGIGPWSNVVLAAVFGLSASAAAFHDLDAVADVLGLLGWLNLGLAAFNLVPGAPLDGGRLLRALVWRVTGDRHRSVVVAAWFGIALGAALCGWALWLVGLGGAAWTGLWVGVVGAYVLRAARLELSRGRLSQWLAGYAVADLAPPVDSDEPLPSDVPVVAASDPADRLVGLLDRDQPHVRVDDGATHWHSTLQAIDARVREVRTHGRAPAEVVS